MDQQVVALLIEHGTMMCSALAGGLAVSTAYRFAVAPDKRAAWLPPVVIVLAVTTALIISVIKASIALSLGLIGALSVARFRSSISDPRQLALILVAIAIGIGFGAGELLLTGVGTAFIAGLIAIFYGPAFWEPSGAAQPRISARLNFVGSSQVRVGPISEYLNKRQVAHRIRGTTRKANVTCITIRFYNCSVSMADHLVRDLADVYPECELESELQVKSADGAEPSVPHGDDEDEPARTVAPRLGSAAGMTLKPAP